MIELSEPLYARIYDHKAFDYEIADEFIVSRVEKLELPNKQHEKAVIIYGGGLRSEKFALIDPRHNTSNHEIKS